MKNNQPGDDLFYDRLLFYLNKTFPFSVQAVKPIKNRVYKISSPEKTFILKAFHSYHSLNIQKMFIDSLSREGFSNTCSFLRFTDEILFFDGSYYATVEYIPSADPPFTFRSEPDRLDGLCLLRQYHSASQRLAGPFESMAGRYKILKKWRRRTALFLKNIPIVKFFVQKEMLDEILIWADWALKGLEQNLSLMKQSADVVLHGDLADHNFIRSGNHTLYLIDFDLISIGLPIWDYLQYAYRILPYLNWSLDELNRIESFSNFLKERAFIFALAYPSDIFREWNRAVREHHISKMDKLRPLLHLTVKQFEERQQFFKDLQDLLK